jgi:hypothetical protein
VAGTEGERDVAGMERSGQASILPRDPERGRRFGRIRTIPAPAPLPAIGICPLTNRELATDGPWNYGGRTVKRSANLLVLRFCPSPDRHE